MTGEIGVRCQSPPGIEEACEGTLRVPAIIAAAKVSARRTPPRRPANSRTPARSAPRPGFAQRCGTASASASTSTTPAATRVLLLRRPRALRSCVQGLRPSVAPAEHEPDPAERRDLGAQAETRLSAAHIGRGDGQGVDDSAKCWQAFASEFVRKSIYQATSLPRMRADIGRASPPPKPPAPAPHAPPVPGSTQGRDVVDARPRPPG